MFSDSMMLGGGRKAAFSIANSVRLDGVADYFTRTPTLAGNQKTWTFSCWVKRSSLVDGSYTLLNAGTSSAAFTGFSWDNGTYANHLTFYCNATGANLRCSMLSRDVAAWYHLCLAVDTDLPDAQTSDRVRLYVNGQRVTAFDQANYPAHSTATHVNAAEPHQIGKRIGTSEYLDGYVASPILVDGAALDPSQFGETDPVTGSWRPKRIGNLDFGTNGFHLDFADAGGSGGTVNTAFAGGFGDCLVVINPARPLPNKAWITQIGVTQNSAESGKSVYIVRDDGGNGYTVMWVSAPFNHAGSGLQQVAVNYLVPETGTYLMAVGCPGGGLAWGHDSDLIGTAYPYSLTTRSLGESFVAEIAPDVTMSEAPPALTWTDGSLGLSATGVNHWLPVSLGAADVVSDTPTNNFATWNVVEPGRAIFSNGSLTVTSNSPDYWHAVGSMGVSSGKWYFEVTPTAGSGWRVVGVSSTQVASTSPPFNGAGNYGYVSHLGSTRNNGVTSAYGDSYASGDVIGVALDLDSGKLWFAKNNTWQASGDPVAGVNAAFTGLAGTFFPCLGDDASGGVQAFTANFGQRAFAHTPPAGFKSLCTANLPKPVIQAPAKHMDVVTYTGTGMSQDVTGLGFLPDLVWCKRRDNIESHGLYDSVRGPTKMLYSDLTNGEATDANGIVSFNAGGFTANGAMATNGSGGNYVAWCWKAGGAAVANTTGSIPSTVSANPTAGFSIVTYTGIGAAGATIGHGLGVAPRFMLFMVRNNTGGEPHHVYHVAMGPEKRLTLNTTNAASASAVYWDNTSPTDTVFSVGYGQGTNGFGYDIVAYCWAEVPGFSKFGSYTGNGSSDGPFVHCGFRPCFVLIKRTDSAENWRMFDAARSPRNVVDNMLETNNSNPEALGNANKLDFTANGFKLRGIDAGTNSNGTYIYAAFAEAPLGGAKTVPAKAR
jgi:hypothetical protein